MALHQQFKSSYKRGYAALFAVLVSSLILSIGLSIINITLKEISLSASGRESQFAFYAADSAAECAQYWDYQGAFAIPLDVDGSAAPADTSPPSIYCFNSGSTAGIDLTTLHYEDAGRTTEVATTTFDFTMPGTDFCGSVEVGKYAGVTYGLKTIIRAYGRNTCVNGSRLQVERGLDIDY